MKGKDGYKEKTKIVVHTYLKEKKKEFLVEQLRGKCEL